MSDLTIGHGTPLREYKCLCGCTEFINILLAGSKCKVCKKCLGDDKCINEAIRVYGFQED